MNRKFVSDFWNNGIHGHMHYDFVDVAINNDNLLFIDPILLENSQDVECQHANAIVQSYFNSFYAAYKSNNEYKKRIILAHAGEQNGTHLGYGNGINGKGNTVHGLLNTFSPLKCLLQDVSSIKKAEDLAVLLPGFAEDGLSDLLTNILHDWLNRYTATQMKKYGVNSNSLIKFWFWNPVTASWEEVQRPAYCINGKELLVVPKSIVRKKYLFSTSQYFNRIILERIRDDGGYIQENGKPIPKKEIIKSKRYSGKHWQYDEAVSFTKHDNNALSEYHQKIPFFYAEHGLPLSNDELDELIYGCPILQIA